MENQSSNQTPPSGPIQINQNPTYILPSKKSYVLLYVVVLIFVLGFGFVTYAFVKQIGFFAPTPEYSESNFFSGILNKSKEIKSMSSTFGASLTVVARESDAKPFTIQNSNEGELRQKYQNDKDRIKSVQIILSSLQSIYRAHSIFKSDQRKNIPQLEKPFPTSLEKLASDFTLNNEANKNQLSITDPITGKKYDYKVVEGGRDFSLVVEFETQSAVNSLLKYNEEPSVFVEGKKVTFTKDTSVYFYISNEPPKPLLVKLGEYARYLPPDIDVEIALGITSNLKSDDLADWKFNLDAKGGLGDLIYAVNIDALKKDSDYFFRINKISSLFISSLPSIKGQWVKVSTATTTDSKTTRFNEFSHTLRSFPEYEKSYKELRESIYTTLKKVAEIADEEQMIFFKNKPHKEKVGERELTRYDLGFKRESIINFYLKVLEEAKKDKKSLLSQMVNDQGALEYLQSKEFEEVFDYLEKNSSKSVWIDEDGYVAMAEYSFRIVPPDTATQLKDKQANLVLKYIFTDINKPVLIEAPKDAKSIEMLMEDFEKNTSYSTRTSATIKSNLASVRAQAEIVYDANNGYGKTSFTAGPCKKKSGTLFGDSGVYSSIEEAAGGDASKATCTTTLKGGKVEAYAVSVPLVDLGNYSWCVDSTGNSRQIEGKITTSSCK